MTHCFWRRWLIGFCLPLLLLWGSGCQDSRNVLLVGAAASLTDVLQDLAPRFHTEYPRTEVQFHFAATGPIQRQLSQGAPLDGVFLAAAEPMDKLIDQGKIDPATVQTILSNELVLIQPVGAEPIADFQALRSPTIDHIAVGEFQTVPAGAYAQALLNHEQLLPAVADKLVFGNNVRQVLAFVAAGNAEAGLVYATDARHHDQVQIVAIAPPDSHPAIEYPVGISTATPQREAAKQWITFLNSPTAQAIFLKHGFQLVHE